MNSLAIAIPILPVDGFVKHLNGSMNSLVGPAVTRTFFPFKSNCTSEKIAFSIFSTVGNFPFPTSPQANNPLSGSTKLKPSFKSLLIFSLIIGLLYMTVFIAGTIYTFVTS